MGQLEASVAALKEQEQQQQDAAANAAAAAAATDSLRHQLQHLQGELEREKKVSAAAETRYRREVDARAADMQQLQRAEQQQQQQQQQLVALERELEATRIELRNTR